MKNKILTLILFTSILINAEPKKVFQSGNSMNNKTVSSEKMINVDALKKDILAKGLSHTKLFRQHY